MRIVRLDQREDRIDFSRGRSRWDNRAAQSCPHKQRDRPSGGHFVSGKLLALRTASPRIAASDVPLRSKQMNQPQFETADLRHLVRVQAKGQAMAERKRLATDDALRQRRQQTETMLIDIKNALRLLDQSIEAELQKSPTRDPHHFAFPMTVRALITRRENLKSTITLLLSELTKSDRGR